MRRIVRARLREVATNPFGRWATESCAAILIGSGSGPTVIACSIPSKPLAADLDIVNVFRIRPRAVAYEGYEFGET